LKIPINIKLTVAKHCHNYSVWT